MSDKNTDTPDEIQTIKHNMLTHVLSYRDKILQLAPQ